MKERNELKDIKREAGRPSLSRLFVYRWRFHPFGGAYSSSSLTFIFVFPESGRLGGKQVAAKQTFTQPVRPSSALSQKMGLRAARGFVSGGHRVTFPLFPGDASCILNWLTLRSPPMRAQKDAFGRPLASCGGGFLRAGSSFSGIHTAL